MYKAPATEEDLEKFFKAHQKNLREAEEEFINVMRWALDNNALNLFIQLLPVVAAYDGLMAELEDFMSERKYK